MTGEREVRFALDFREYSQARLLAEFAREAELMRLRIRVGEKHG
jgi:hypothetical protein